MDINLASPTQSCAQAFTLRHPYAEMHRAPPMGHGDVLLLGKCCTSPHRSIGHALAFSS